jgi:hypothetical protein
MVNRFTDSWHGELEAVVVELHTNPVFHMGLASKELFHSNFLGWVLQTSQENAELVLSQWLEADSSHAHAFSVEQEQQHFDLVARIPGFVPIVFENKLFQTLSPTQLQEYNSLLAASDSDLRGATRIALTLLGPEGGQQYLGWRCHRFDELLKPLSLVADRMVSKSFEQQLLRRYIRVLELLIEFRRLLDFKSDDEIIDYWLDCSLELSQPKWNDYAKKVRYANVAFRLQQLLPASDEVTYRFDWSRTHPLVECFFADSRGEHQIGWQLQNSDFKVAVRLVAGGLMKRSYEKPESPEKRREAREAYAKSHFSFWFQPLSVFHELTVQPEPLIFRTKSSGLGSGQFYGYAPDFVDRRASLPRLTLHDVAILHDAYESHARYGTKD